MPISQKDILCIIASEDLTSIDLDRFLSPDIGQVIIDGDSPLKNCVYS